MKTGLKIETQLPEVPVTQVKMPCCVHLGDHHAIGLPPAVLLRAGMDADIAVGIGRGGMIAVAMMAHDLEHGRCRDVPCVCLAGYRR